ncbi:AI-2E family transporter [uncultured Methanobrevibacter sp.]|uniref:AI-2E family transporter n=1 Tax=uncultured Methanobrevibacter sp. TaxID=253161 RepID=UPI0026083E77|nr:AI-2E family transporter [uncultured Methanobrevibacter sp.]
MEKNLKEYISPPVMLILFLLVISVMIVSPVLNMVILGAILAYAIRPLARKINLKIKFKSISIFVAIILVMIPLVLLIVYIISVISGVLSNVLIVNPNGFNLNLDTLINQLVNSLPPNISSNIDVVTLKSSILNAIKGIGSVVLNYFVSLAGKLFSISVDLFILFASIYYFIRDGGNCYKFVESFIPESSKDFFTRTVESVKDVLKSIFYGHFLTSLIIGIIGAIGYSLLGYPQGVFLGVLTGIFQLIPVFGPWPIYWTLAIVDLISGNYVRVVIVLLFGFFLSLSDMYIRPALSSHYADIHPLILLIGFLAGPLVYGIVGFILGPLILGITYAVLDNFRIELNKNKED